MGEVIPWVKLLAVIDPFYPKGERGRPPIGLERMFYGLAEFEITDPDGYVLCFGQSLDDASDLPTPAV